MASYVDAASVVHVGKDGFKAESASQRWFPGGFGVVPRRRLGGVANTCEDRGGELRQV